MAIGMGGAIVFINSDVFFDRFLRLMYDYENDTGNDTEAA